MNEKLREITDLISAHDMENDFRVRFRVRKTLRKIPDQEIIEGIGMAQMPLIIYLLDLKYARTRIIPIQNDLVIRTGKLNAANMSYLAVYLHFLRIEKNVLHIEGNISLPAVFEKRNTFYIRCNGEKVRCEMSECGLDCKLGENIYEKRTVFCTQIPLEERDYKIEFFNCIDGEECGYGRINAMRFSPVADCLADQYCRFENRMVFIQDNFIMIQKVDSEETFRDREEKFRKAVLDRYEDIGLWAVDLRKNILLCQRKKSDCSGCLWTGRTGRMTMRKCFLNICRGIRRSIPVLYLIEIPGITKGCHPLEKSLIYIRSSII